MNILAFDTTMGACSAAVLRGGTGDGDGDGDGIVTGLFERRARGHAEALMPMIGEVMARAGLDFSGLDRIAVTRGPGTFTGVRIGIAAARGLALATGLAVVTETSLRLIRLMAARRLAGAPGTAPILAVTDARRGQLYVQPFDAEGMAVSRPEILAPELALARMRALGAHVALAGSGADILSAAAARSGSCLEAAASLTDIEPDAAMFAAIAPNLVPAEVPPSPLYLRPPDAKPQQAAAIARQRS